MYASLLHRVYRFDPLHPASLYLRHNNFRAVGGFVEVFHCENITLFFGYVQWGVVRGRTSWKMSKNQDESVYVRRPSTVTPRICFRCRNPSNCSIDAWTLGKLCMSSLGKASQPHIRFKFNCFLLSFRLLLSFRVKENGVKSCHKAKHFALHTRDSFYRIMGLEAARVKQTWFCIVVHHRFILWMHGKWNEIENSQLFEKWWASNLLQCHCSLI